MIIIVVIVLTLLIGAVVGAVTGAGIGRQNRPAVAHRTRFSQHRLEIDADEWRQVNLVDHQ